MSGDDARSARQNLLDTAVGKAKEVTGALLGNDSLTREGKLRQAEARANDEADTTDAVAEVRGERAAEEITDAQRRARDQRQAAAQRSGEAEQAAEAERRREHERAEQVADSQERSGAAAVAQQARTRIDAANTDARTEESAAGRQETDAARQRQAAEQQADDLEQTARQERAAARRLDPNDEGTTS